ncbi:hypothetical protein F4779DRAFT_597008 [Xylariaceae sp. FL0662B]|nr:hypothetical protein F4779DRAFT_597008 [Xylariaceae sp. FL0662B]
MGAFTSKNDFPVDGRTVLITGGSRGMGREVGHQLAAKGANVVIVARDHAKLEEGIEYIRQGAKLPQVQRFYHIGADLTAPGESVRVIAEATTWNDGSPPDVVWCCAGSSHPTLLVDTPVAQLRAQMDSNYFTSAYMAHAVINAWLNTSRAGSTAVQSSAANTANPRHLIFTGSFLSFYTFAGYVPYSPTKAALRSLSDTLSQEMNLYRATTTIKVRTVYPATIFTESYEAENLVKSDLTKKLEEGDKGQTAEDVARISIRGLEAGQEMITTTFLTRLAMCGVLGGTIRGGFWKGLVDWLIACVMGVAMVFVRMDMDSKVRRWGREHQGPKMGQ